MLATTAPGEIDTAALTCRHCGDACDAGHPVSGDDHFCCAGCQTVYSLLADEGLSGFYACAVAPGVSQRTAADRPADRFASLDDAAVAATFLEFDAGTVAGARLPVPSLHCASCVWLLERLWQLLPGVVASEVDLLHRSVRVTYRPREVSLRKIAERMAALGYEMVTAVEQPSPQAERVRRRLYRQIGVAGFAFGNIMIFSIPRYANGAPLEGGFQRLFDVLNLAFALPVLVFSASSWFAGAWRALRTRHATLDLPVAIGLAVIFARSVVDIWSGVGEGFLDSFSGLVFFLLIGRLFQNKAFEQIAFDRTYRSFFPLSVRVERDGGIDVVPLEQLETGADIVVRPQELVPADAVLRDGYGAVDYAFATGEQTPVQVASGGLVQAGGRVVGPTLRLRVVGAVSQSRLASLWANPVLSTPKRAWIDEVADRFGSWFTVFALALAALGAFWWWPDARMSASVATAVLIVACPCALTLAAPVTLGTALGQLGRRGLYLRNTGVVFELSRIDAIAFDKTGTLTSPTAPVVVDHRGLSDDDWRLARAAAAESVHPISRALTGAGPASGAVSELREVAGQGLEARVDGRLVRIGGAGFVEVPDAAPADVTHVSVDGRVGWARLVVPTRDGLDQAIGELSRTHTVQLISGDHGKDASRWRPLFGTAMTFGQSPDAKLAAVQRLRAAGRHVLMLGDGLNDAGALAAANVGVAVSDQTACVVPACDAVVSGDRLRALPAFLRYARRARHVVGVCFLVSVVYNAVGLTLALTGMLTPLASAILMPVSSLTVVAIGAGAMRWAGARMVTS